MERETRKYAGGLVIEYQVEYQPCYYVQMMNPRNEVITVGQFPTEGEANACADDMRGDNWVHVVQGTHKVLNKLSHRYE